MKNKEFIKLLKKNKSHSNSNSDSGFTLTELLVGLIMSIFVIGALGFGLMQMLRVTQKGSSDTLVRNESSRALDFISDEMRRSQSIEVDVSDTNIDALGGTDYTGKKKSGATVRLALNIPGVTGAPAIYSVAPNVSPWKGPLVIYRWGPNLDANGNYTDPTDTTNWSNQALVDGISDETATAVGCDLDADGNDDTYQGFFACMIDDDGDLITENATDADGDGIISFKDDVNDRNDDGELNFGDTLTNINGDSDITLADSAWDKNGDGEINAGDAADIDGLAITAQLYLTGETKDASGVNAGTYSADTKTVARARTTPGSNNRSLGAYVTSYRTLKPSFGCNTTEDWRMRTDFGDSFNNPSGLDKWDFQENAQPQPIVVNSNTLIVTSIPRGLNPSESGYVNSGSECLNIRDNNGHGGSEEADFEGNKSLGANDDWDTSDTNNIVAVSHAINFNDPRTFNGDPDGDCDVISCYSTDSKVYTQKENGEAELNPYVKMLKQGSLVPDIKGYDINNDGDTDDPGEQVSLGEFLYSKGLAIPVDEGNSNDKTITTTFRLPNNSAELKTYLASSNLSTSEQAKFKTLGDDKRIIAFEIGKSDVSDPSADPGVDFQDNIFVLQSDAFKQKYKTYTDTYNNIDSDGNPVTDSDGNSTATTTTLEYSVIN